MSADQRLALTESGNVGVGRFGPAMVFTLDRAAPNPSAGEIQVRFSLPSAAEVEIDVLDLQGRRVATPRREGAGWHSMAWPTRDRSGRPLRPGSYVLRLVAGGQVRTQRFVSL